MSSEKTDALVIRQTDFSETSKVVTFFTREFGKVSMLAKGARRLKGPFEAAIDLLTASRIVFIRKSTTSLDLLTEAQLLSRFRPIDRDLNRLYGGYYVAELLSDLTEEYDPHLDLFDETLSTLADLAERPDPKLGILRFELVILREIGQLPAFDGCVSCGKPITKDSTYALWVSQGGVICRGCQQYNDRQPQIDIGTLTLLSRFSAESGVAIERLAVSADQSRQMRHVVTAAISHTLGRRPKMMKYLQL